MKQALSEFKRYLNTQEFDIENMDHYYQMESIFKAHNKALLLKRLRTIAEGLNDSIYRLNSLTESKLDSNDNFKDMLVDFRHASLITFPEGTRKAFKEFWTIFDPKVKQFLEDEKPTQDMAEMIRMTHINSIRKSQVDEFTKELSFITEDSKLSYKEFVTNSFDDSIAFMLDNIREDKTI